MDAKRREIIESVVTTPGNPQKLNVTKQEIQKTYNCD